MVMCIEEESAAVLSYHTPLMSMALNTRTGHLELPIYYHELKKEAKV